MGMTMSQKILAAHAGLSEVKAGQLIEAKLDMVLGNDVTCYSALKTRFYLKKNLIVKTNKIYKIGSFKLMKFRFLTTTGSFL